MRPAHGPLSLPLLLALVGPVAFGCKCSRAPEAEAPRRPTPVRVTSSAGANSTDGGSGFVREDVTLAVPLTPSTLSVLEPSPEGCEWLRMDPVAKLRVRVALFDGSCRGARIAWSKKGERALVWFDPETMHVEMASDRKSPLGEKSDGAAEDDRLYEVTLATGTVKKLPVPEVPGSVDEIGIGKDGEALALVQESLPEKTRESGRTLVDGHEVTWSPETEGLPALAHAYELSDEGKWIRIETKATTEGWDYAMGVDALDVAKTLGPRSVELLSPHYQGDAVVNAGTLERLKPFQPSSEEGGGSWIQGGSEAGRFYIWEVSGEFAYTTGLIVLATADGLSPAPDLGFDDSTLVSVHVQGPFLLVAHNGTGGHPRLYELRTRARVYASETARAATFWPDFAGGGSATR